MKPFLIGGEGKILGILYSNRHNKQTFERMMRDFSGTPQVTTKLNDVKKSLLDSKTLNKSNNVSELFFYAKLVSLKSTRKIH